MKYLGLYLIGMLMAATVLFLLVDETGLAAVCMIATTFTAILTAILMDEGR